ncbi:unnamed protein product [Lota lota]
MSPCWPDINSPPPLTLHPTMQAETHLLGPAPRYVLGASIHPPTSTSQTHSYTRINPPTPTPPPPSQPALI